MRYLILILGALCCLAMSACCGHPAATQTGNPASLQPVATEVAAGLSRTAKIQSSPVIIQTGSAETAARVVISRDFGQTILADQKVGINAKSNAMSVLHKVARVETSYGGSFVDSIDNLCSQYSGNKKVKEDWFFYVNGLVSNTGALDYPLSGDEIVQWDFHNWSYRQLIPAMIGHFPEPFKGGIRGTVYPALIVYYNGFEDQAVGLKTGMIKMGVERVDVRPAEMLTEAEKASGNLIIVGPADSPLVQELNMAWKKLGFFAYFDHEQLVSIDANGSKTAGYTTRTGVIQATQNPWNPNGIGAGENAVWLISGCDTEGIQYALDSLICEPSACRYYCGAIIQSDRLVKIP